MPRPWKQKPIPLEDVQETVPERIKRLRKLRGFTQVELAERIGISRGLEAAYEQGKVRLFDEMVIRFARILGVSTDILLGVETIKHEAFASTRFTKRLIELEKLSETKKKVILNNLDDFIKANIG